MSSETTLTGRTRFRSKQCGIWPFRSTKLVLQIEESTTTVIVDDFNRKKDRHTSVYWRDAKVSDLTRAERREIFVRENPR